MPIQKIKSGRVITVTAEEFVGEKGIIFYDETTPALRLSDGITPGGILFSGGGGPGYILPPATTSTLGGVIVGPGLSIGPTGILSATNTTTYTLPIASFATLGGIRVGSGLTIDSNGLLSAIATSTYVLTTATTSTLGGVKIGAGLSITGDGTLSANTASGVADAFKTIVIQGSPNVVATGTDTLELIAGASISIFSTATTSSYKSITIAVSAFVGNLDGGAPDTVYGGTVNIDGGTV